MGNRTLEILEVLREAYRQLEQNNKIQHENLLTLEQEIQRLERVETVQIEQQKELSELKNENEKLINENKRYKKVSLLK